MCMQPTLCCQLAINVNHSLEAPAKLYPPHPPRQHNKPAICLHLWAAERSTCAILRGGKARFWRQVRAPQGRFQELECFGSVDASGEWPSGGKLTKERYSEVKAEKLFFSLFSQARGLVLFLVFQALTGCFERHYVQSGAAFLSFPELRCNVASWAGGGLNCKNVRTWSLGWF